MHYAHVQRHREVQPGQNGGEFSSRQYYREYQQLARQRQLGGLVDPICQFKPAKEELQFVCYIFFNSNVFALIWHSLRPYSPQAWEVDGFSGAWLMVPFCVALIICQHSTLQVLPKVTARVEHSY
jgi:hypothetical protein